VENPWLTMVEPTSNQFALTMVINGEQW
jgi:hypothetical protein